MRHPGDGVAETGARRGTHLRWSDEGDDGWTGARRDPACETRYSWPPMRRRVPVKRPSSGRR
ncbi:MAG: hypothetical protein ACPG4T_13245, partial [Nannocystaceae bacterium]